MLPSDINMLVSYLNTKLRDDDMSLEHLVTINDLDYQEFMNRLRLNDYFFDDQVNQIKAK